MPSISFLDIRHGGLNLCYLGHEDEGEHLELDRIVRTIFSCTGGSFTLPMAQAHFLLQPALARFNAG